MVKYLVHTQKSASSTLAPAPISCRIGTLVVQRLLNPSFQVSSILTFCTIAA